MNITSDPEQGYSVDYHNSETGSGEFAHYFCGPHEVHGADCPNCAKPLLRFLALDTSDNRLNLQKCSFPILSLFFCWTCNIAQEPFYYQTRDDGSVNLLNYGQGGFEEDFPYEAYPVFFPGTVARLIAISPEQQHVLSLLNSDYEGAGITEDEYFEIIEQEQYLDIDKRGHQIGGEPYLVQGIKTLQCPICQTAMPLFASIRNDCLDSRGFIGDDLDYVQVLFHFCRQCHVMGAYQRCD